MVSKRIRNSLKLAVLLAKKYPHDLTYHLASCILRGKEVVSVGYNQSKTHSKAPCPYHSIHAEADAIIGTDQQKLTNSTLFVARVGYNNRMVVMMAKPCIHCYNLISHSGIRQCYYTISDQKIGHYNFKNNVQTEYDCVI